MTDATHEPAHDWLGPMRVIGVALLAIALGAFTIGYVLDQSAAQTEAELSDKYGVTIELVGTRHGTQAGPIDYLLDGQKALCFHDNDAHSLFCEDTDGAFTEVVKR